MSEQPVAKLNEYMVKLGITPKYEVVDVKTGTHINNFLGRVESPIVPNGPIYTAESVGLSKKEAKRQAALKFIQKYLEDTNNNPLLMTRTPNFSSACLVKVTENNRNSVLQLVCSKYKLPNPVFEELDSTGPPHAKRFTFECRVSHFFTEGKGGTKAEAKLQATTKMIQLLMQEIEVYEIFESSQSTVANSTEIISFSNNFKGPQLPVSVGIFGRRSSSTLSDISVDSNGSSLLLSRASTTRVESIAESIDCAASKKSLIDLDEDSQPDTVPLDKARSKSMTSLLHNNDNKSSRELLEDWNRAQVISKIDATLKEVEKGLYNEILNTLPNRELPRRRLVTVLDHEFEVCINYGPHAKILEDNQQCVDPSIRIAALTKLLMDVKDHAATSGVEKFNK